MLQVKRNTAANKKTTQTKKPHKFWLHNSAKYLAKPCNTGLEGKLAGAGLLLASGNAEKPVCRKTLRRGEWSSAAGLTPDEGQQVLRACKQNIRVETTDS